MVRYIWARWNVYLLIENKNLELERVMMTMVPVYLHVFINNSYLCAVIRTGEAHLIIFSV